MIAVLSIEAYFNFVAKTNLHPNIVKWKIFYRIQQARDKAQGDVIRMCSLTTWHAQHSCKSLARLNLQ